MKKTFLKKDIILENIGENIYFLRKSKKLTIEKMADSTFLSESYLRAIEKGIYACSIINFLKICKALEVEPSQILEGSIDKSNLSILKQLSKLEDKNISNNIVEILKN